MIYRFHRYSIYRLFQDYLSLFVLILFLGIATLIFLDIFPRVLYEETYSQEIQSQWLYVAFIIYLGFIPAIIGFLSYPNIETKSDGFRLIKLPYRSEWLKWEDIDSIQRDNMKTRVHKYSLKLGKQDYFNVSFKKLKFPFSIVGFFAGIKGSGFVIGSRINQFDELMRTIRINRPDLFEDEIL